MWAQYEPLVSQLPFARSGAAAQIKAAIERKDEGASVFLAPSHLRAGGRWAPALAQAVSHATVFVLLVTDKGIGRWQEIEYDAASPNQ
jgi:hypothetical protein